MNILINVISVKEGGSRVVLNKLLEKLLIHGSQHHWFVALNPVLASDLQLDSTVTPIVFSWVGKTPFHVRFWYEFTLPSLINSLNIDLLYSQTNYLPKRHLSCPTLLLEQHAGHFSPVFNTLMEEHIDSLLGRFLWRSKGEWVKDSVRKATRVTVQTRALAKQIVEETGVFPEKFSVIPHGAGLADSHSPRPYPENEPWRIGYITKYGVQKDFATLFEAIALLGKAHWDVSLILTLGKSTSEYGAIEEQISAAGIIDVVENYGEVTADRIPELYDTLDVFVFPSLCESFGFPLVEAMARGLPVVAADIESTAEITGDAVLRYQPSDAKALAEQLAMLMENRQTYESYAQRSIDCAQQYSWDNAAIKTMAVIEELLACK